MASQALQKTGKLNRLITEWPAGAVYTSAWLVEHGYSRALIHRYVQSGWIQPVGVGAYRRTGDRVGWPGALWALQSQLHLDVHVGGVTALEEAGFAHNLRLGAEERLELFGTANQALPGWFKQFVAEQSIDLLYVSTRLFGSSRTGVRGRQIRGLEVQVADPERAILEVLHLVPYKQSFEQAAHLLEGLTQLRPKLVQQLLVECSSIKVRRLMMYFGERQGHLWFARLEKSEIDLGRGKRALVPGGRLDLKYLITVPRETPATGEEGA